MSDQPPGRAGVAELGWMAALVLVPAGVAGAAAAYVVLWLLELLGPTTAAPGGRRARCADHLRLPG
ncbi:hypothetical protein [Pseudonocardia sp. DLS-67]